MRACSSLALPEKYSSGESGDGVLEVPVVEAYPVGVVQHVHAAQRFRKAFWIVEGKRKRFDPTLKFAGLVVRIGQRSHGLSHLQQSPGNVFPGIAKRSGHGMSFG